MEEKQVIDSGMTLIDFFNLMIKNILLIITITVAVTVVGVIYTFNIAKPQFVSEGSVMVQVKRVEEVESTKDYNLSESFSLMKPVSEFIQKDLVINSVIEELNLDMTIDQFKRNLSVSYSTGSIFIIVKYESGDPEQTQLIVNTLIDNTIEIANATYPILNNTIYQMDSALLGEYSAPNKMLNVAISVILGAIISVVAVLLIEVLNTTVRNKKELEALLPGYQIIGVIPDIAKEGE